jgi:hypothetical protein
LAAFYTALRQIWVIERSRVALSEAEMKCTMPMAWQAKLGDGKYTSHFKNNQPKTKLKKQTKKPNQWKIIFHPQTT